MAKRTFTVFLSGSVTIELDDQVINVVDEEWRKNLYDLDSPEEIAEHVAYNLFINDTSLPNMDGWADQPASNARITESEFKTEGAFEI